MRPSTIVAVALVAACGVTTAAGQTGTPVTVETRDGDTIDGTLVSATDTEVVIRVAGQSLTLAVDRLRYISFDGRIERPVDAAGDQRLLDALEGLKAQLVGLGEDDGSSSPGSSVRRFRSCSGS